MVNKHVINVVRNLVNTNIDSLGKFQEHEVDISHHIFHQVFHRTFWSHFWRLWKMFFLTLAILTKLRTTNVVSCGRPSRSQGSP